MAVVELKQEKIMVGNKYDGTTEYETQVAFYQIYNYGATSDMRK